MIDFVLRSRPFLLEFKITGSIEDLEDLEKDGVLRFDFSHLKNLRETKVLIEALNVPGNKNRRWFGLNIPYKEKMKKIGVRNDTGESSKNELKFCVDLTWSVENPPSSVYLQRAKRY